jgi:DNA-binding beta-propeller fold protein YncE
MTRGIISVGVAVTVIIGIARAQNGLGKVTQSGVEQASGVPIFQVDPSWPKIPDKWVFGLVSGIAVDPQNDHVWIIQRPRTVKPEQKAMAAPAVLEFDTAGNFIQAWGGPGAGYEWPETEHGIHVDYKGYVWIAGSGKRDDQLLKFTKAGKLVMQIGHSGKSGGNTDTKNLGGPADVFVYPKTNEVFVADGYHNNRVIVFDADTGAFKRMWTEFGRPPTDERPTPAQETGPGPEVFGHTHSVRISNDGLVYVCDRAGNRVQVFTVDGKYVTQVFISRDKATREKAIQQDLESRPTQTVFGNPLKVAYLELETAAAAGSTAGRATFSPDSQQRFLYVIDRSKQQIIVLNRKTLEILGSFGRVGEAPGEFYVLHDIAVDKEGNIYTAEVNDDGGRRAQKLQFKGMSSASTR